MIFARKVNKISEFHMIYARKMPEFYVIIARKIFFPKSGRGARAPPESPTPMLRHVAMLNFLKSHIPCQNYSYWIAIFGKH